MIGDDSMDHLYVRGSLGRCSVGDFGRRPPIFAYLRPTLGAPISRGTNAFRRGSPTATADTPRPRGPGRPAPPFLHGRPGCVGRVGRHNVPNKGVAVPSGVSVPGHRKAADPVSGQRTDRVRYRRNGRRNGVLADATGRLLALDD